MSRHRPFVIWRPIFRLFSPDFRMRGREPAGTTVDGKIVAPSRDAGWCGARMTRAVPVATMPVKRRCAVWSRATLSLMAQRIADDGTLVRRLWGELAALNAEYPHGFVVRLHVLGDFYSVEYVRAWRQYLSDFPALRVFGFTARRPADPIGAELIYLVRDEEDRFMLRFSGADLETHASEVVDRPENARGILCPAESDPDRSCATCGLCMQTNRTISFVRH